VQVKLKIFYIEFRSVLPIRKRLRKAKKLVSLYPKNFSLQVRTGFALAKQRPFFRMGEHERNNEKFSFNLQKNS